MIIIGWHQYQVDRKVGSAKVFYIHIESYLNSYTAHSAPLGFSTQTKSSEDKTSFSTCYDVKEVRISQEKHLS